MFRKSLIACLFTLLTATSLIAQIVVTDASIGAGDTFTMTDDNVYMLDGLVFVEEGATLIIEAGTVIKSVATPSNGDNTSALIISRGAKIHADGTANHPIIFTAASDDLNDPSDLTWADRGLWGGVILLGRATTNRGVDGQVEGIDSSEVRAAYGGDDDHDCSGIMRYVSIRHAGAELSPGDEINGLTFGAVGDRTIIENIEVFSNLDGGYEWFGGTVNTRWLIAAFCADDGFDYDEGWRGNNQFWFCIQATDKAGRIGEHDGGTINETAPPFATPHIYNATYIGAGSDAFPEGDGDFALLFRDNAGGVYFNSILTEYNGASNGGAINIEDIQGADSRERLEAGDLRIVNNIFWDFANGPNLADIAPQPFVADHLTANNNQIVNPQLRGISRVADGNLDPRPSASSPAANGAVDPENNFFRHTDYQGAFAPTGTPWIAGWTALAQEGHLASTSTGGTVLVYTWVSNSADFSSTIVVDNFGDSDATVNLTARRANGDSEAADPIVVPANGFVSLQAGDVFGTLGVGSGYTVVLESNATDLRGRWVTRDNVALVPSQGLAVAMPGPYDINANVGQAVEFGFMPGDASFQSAPVVVNLSPAPADITIYYFDAAGNHVATDVAANAAPWSPVIPRVNQDGGNLSAVAVSNSGNLTGAVFVFNSSNQTAIGNTSSVSGFQPPN